ncbi:hypothetical protein AKJ16_DCAP15389 [Drosera capensis]
MLLLRYSLSPSPLPLLSPPHPLTSHRCRTTAKFLLRRPPMSAAAADVDSVDIGGGGPVELSPDRPSVFETEDETAASPVRIGASVVLFGAITFFLFRSIRRRAKRAKELKFRSSGVKKALKDEALDKLKAIGNMSVNPGSPPSPVQTLLGGLTAGVIAIVLYKFSTTVEATLSRQAISDDFSARQITITIRTIVNGLCYLATFVFGFNSVGLFVYSAQLAFNSFMEGGTGNGAKGIDEKIQGNLNSSPESPTSVEETSSSPSEQTSNAPEK